MFTLNNYWASVGFIAGEGNIDWQDDRLRIRASQIELKPLLILVETLGGKIYGPIIRGGTRKPIYIWAVANTEAAGVIMTLLPGLKLWHVGRYNQAIKVLHEWRSRKPARKHRIQCPKGHPYSGNNLYITKDNHRQCRACTASRGKESRAAIKSAIEGGWR